MLKETLNQIGEKEIHNRLKEFMDPGQIDDDTATILTEKKELLINNDVLVEEVHFNQATTTPEDLGWKAIASNVSDLVASGVEDVIGITVGLVTPPDTEWEWVNEMYKGMQKALEKYGGKVIGGDCSKGNQKIISITAIGTLGPLRLHRSNAQPGDVLVTSGAHGLSRLGLALLQSESIPNSNQLTKSLKVEAINTHQKPSPPIEALKKLIDCKPLDLPWRAAGTDSSDGLLDAVECIAQKSNCKIILERNTLPKPKDWPQGNHWDQWCLNGGEDFQLVLSLPISWAKEWVKVEPLSTIIGEVAEGPPKIIWSNGENINTNGYNNYQHF